MSLATAPALLVVLLGAGLSADSDASAFVAGVGIDASKIPPAAREAVPELQRLLDRRCPNLPAVWVVAQAEAESGWNPRAYSPAGAAGLLQFMPAAWSDAGGPGGPWTTAARPGVQHPVWDPATHLAVAVPWMCGNLRLVTAHLQSTGKPTQPLDAMAVCHIAGCSRVTGSRTGVPAAGEAGCGAGCARQVNDYLAAIHRYIDLYAASAPALPGGTGAARPYRGGGTGCVVPDPSGTGGCVTGALAWLMGQAEATFGSQPVACWSARGGDLRSDHPKGMACDYTIGEIGAYPTPVEVAHGWALATWLRANSTALHVAYVIWQGRIWSRTHDAQGWRPYTGGGMHDPADVTGGHYDHVHVSTTD